MRSKKIALGERVFHIFNYCFLAFLAIIMLYPFWELIVVSFSHAEEATKLGLKVIPRGFTLEAYYRIFQSKVIGYGYINSITRTVIGTLISVFMYFCTAYPLAKKNLPGRNVFTIYYLVPMFFGGGLIPNFLLVRNLGIYDTIWALIVPGLMTTYNLLIMRNFIMSIPDSLEESALIDGASFFTVMVRIIIPLSMPILATIALWVAVHHWNSWFDAMIYTRSNKNTVLQLILRRVLIEHNSSEVTDSLQGNEAIVTKTMEAATVLVTIGPIVAVYPFLQKYFIKGVMVGSLKG